MINLILLIFGFFFCLIGAFWNPPRVNFTSLGIACAILSVILK